MTVLSQCGAAQVKQLPLVDHEHCPKCAMVLPPQQAPGEAETPKEERAAASSLAPLREEAARLWNSWSLGLLLCSRICHQVLSSLHRDNLNLHRLTRGHEPLRRAIAAARQALFLGRASALVLRTDCRHGKPWRTRRSQGKPLRNTSHAAGARNSVQCAHRAPVCGQSRQRPPRSQVRPGHEGASGGFAESRACRRTEC